MPMCRTENSSRAAFRKPAAVLALSEDRGTRLRSSFEISGEPRVALGQLEMDFANVIGRRLIGQGPLGLFPRTIVCGVTYIVDHHYASCTPFAPPLGSADQVIRAAAWRRQNTKFFQKFPPETNRGAALPKQGQSRQGQSLCEGRLG
jgi:hypothetical protein